MKKIMTTGISVEVAGIPRVINRLKRFENVTKAQCRSIVALDSRLLQSQTKTHWASGPSTARSIRSVSGRFRAGIGVDRVHSEGDLIVGGVTFGTQYAAAHVGPRGSSLTIRPKSKKWLTIPLDAAKTAGGSSRGSAMSNRYRGTFISKGIIFGKIGQIKVAGKVQGKIIPLFKLVRSVTIPRRIFPEELIAWIKPKMEADIEKAAKNV
jgi:hypothetical protein